MTTWSAVIHRNGEPITGPIPITTWEAASILAQLVAPWLGGPVSVIAAVLPATRDTPTPAPHPQLTIYDELAPVP